jgi:mannose-6-phosphate isomerase-like protein (cupin superfamily)
VWFIVILCCHAAEGIDAMWSRLFIRPSPLLAGLLLCLFVAPKVMAADPEGFLVSSDSAARLAGPKGREGDITEVFIAKSQSGGALGLFRQTIAPKSGPPLHIHHSNDEFFYILSGEFKFKIGDRVVTGTPGSVVFVPRGTKHTFENSGTEPGVLLVGVTPGGLEKFFEERQGVDAATADNINKRYDTDSVGPPLR